MGADAVRSGRAGLLIRRHKSGNDNEKREHKASLRAVLRLSLQSEEETNDPLKSGPALAGPAGPPTPPLQDNHPTKTCNKSCCMVTVEHRT